MAMDGTEKRRLASNTVKLDRKERTSKQMFIIWIKETFSLTPWIVNVRWENNHDQVD